MLFPATFPRGVNNFGIVGRGGIKEGEGEGRVGEREKGVGREEVGGREGGEEEPSDVTGNILGGPKL